MASDLPVEVMKSIKKFKSGAQEDWINYLEMIRIPEIQDLIMQEYDAELVGRVSDRRSRTNPIFYREEFEEALFNFEYIREGMDSTTLVIPDETNFPWNQGRLRIIQGIVEGTFGSYVEVDEEQYIGLFNKRPVSVQPYDNTVSKKERIYLIRYTVDVQRREREKFGQRTLVPYPFSNTPPIRLFDPIIKYVENSIPEWIEESLKKSQKEYVR